MGRRFRTANLALALTLIAGACSPALKVDESALSPKNQSTKMFAADGSLITTLRQEENRELLSYDEIPPHVRNAVVAIEDSRFFTHKGIDAKAILRALYKNAATGEIVQGGSTITQQLVRNSLEEVGREQTIERKVKEASFAYQVDSSYSKEKILELYMNTVYFGQGAYGIQTAGQTFFGKNAKELTLGEGATLAGLIKSPVNFDPYTNAERSLSRRNLVLDRMFNLGLANGKDVADAKGTPLAVQKKAEAVRYDFPYFVDYVNRLIQHSDEFSALGESVAERANLLFRGGLRIHTTLNPHMQKAAEEAIRTVLDHPEQDPSASLVAIEPRTGYVRALVGGRDFFAPQEQDPCAIIGAVHADGSAKLCAKVNLALGREGGGSGRQSGSAFKPFVLAAALENGIRLTDKYPASACMSIPNADAGGTRPWRVCNYEESAFSTTTVHEATVRSINVVYAQIIMDVGPTKVVETAKKMGITSPLAAVPSAALGANAVSPLEMASAFTTFPNLGTHVSPVPIIKITDRRGRILWKTVEQRRQALKPSVSYLTTTALEDVIARGTAARHGKIGRPAFGKTGTAQEWRDAWFVGGAGTDLVAAVSVFWPDAEVEMKPSCGGERIAYLVQDGRVFPPKCRPTRIRVTGGSWPTQIWQLFMLKALEGIPASKLPVPKLDVIHVAVDTSRGCLPNPYTPPDLIESQGFIAGTEPTDVCTEPSAEVVRVPQVTGFPQAEAERLLKEAGFAVKLNTEVSRLFPPGRVTRQEPAAGSDAPPGSTITIWISEAPTKKVPDVINLSEVDAAKLLEDQGFEVKVIREGPCTTHDPCFVRDQDPDAGARAGEGTEVTIYVKAKPKPSPSPEPSPSPSPSP